jgi:hypothetical protein
MRYPLISQKYSDFQFFKLAVELVNKKEHLNREGLKKIVNIRATLNKGLSEILKEAFPNSKSVVIPQVNSKEIKYPN